MEALIKWIGSKVKFLDGILPLVPGDAARYFEPFVGGGSLFLGVHDCEQFIINDDCPELIGLYREAQQPSKVFLSHLREINESWRNIAKVFRENSAALVQVYRDFPEWRDYSYVDYIDSLNKKLRLIGYDRVFLQHYTGDDAFEMEKRYQFTRMKVLSKDRDFKTTEAMEDYILTSLKMAVYSYYMELYNGKEELSGDLKRALLMFLLFFSSNGQFVYDRQNEFRPAYAGPQHNGKSLDGKMQLLKNPAFQERMTKTEIHCMDFREFLRRHRPQAGDFVMVDPPLGEMCRKVGSKIFQEKDMLDLLSLLYRSKARWMFLAKTVDLTPEIKQFAGDFHRTACGPHDEVTIVTNY